MTMKPPPMHPTPSARLAEIENDEGVLYLSGNYRRRVLEALKRAYYDGARAMTLPQDKPGNYEAQGRVNS
jgi:hypothetical protein